jgi:glycosyltransferase involved in cell wall biosynthesis
LSPGVLYISYDGMLEPLGQSQVLGYLEPLVRAASCHLISFEKPADRHDRIRMQAMRDHLAAAGISWIPVAYHKTPTAPATAYDIAVGTAAALAIAARRRIQIVHARSYVPALMALPVKRAAGARFLFDMRGFWADERVDGGLWPADGRLYRTAKSLERRFLTAADHVVTLTHASAREIARFPYLKDRMPPLSVIPTCADLERFRPLPMDPARPFTFGYVGSVGTWYLFDEALRFFKALERRRPGARLLVVNRSEHDRIRASIVAAGIDPAHTEVLAAEHRDVPGHIARMHAASAIIKPSYSKMASAPTKLAEYLGCGVPCVGNVNVGDMEEILEGNRVGVALRDFSPADHDVAADRLLKLLDDPATPARCTETARRLFSLESGVAAYRAIYERLAGLPPMGVAAANAGAAQGP